MTPRTFAALFVAAVISVAAAAVAVTLGTPPAADEDAGRPVVADLIDRVNDVASITITQYGTSLTIEKDGDGWVLKDRDGYPVKLETVRTALVGLARLSKLEPKTRQPDNYAKLDLGAPDDPEQRGKRVVLRDAGGDEIANLILGREKMSLTSGGDRGTYVRYPDEPQTWLVRGAVTAPSEARAWVERSLVDIDSGRVARTTIRHPDGKSVTLFKKSAANKDFAVKEMGEGQQIKSSADPDYTATSFARLELDDMKRDPGPDAAGLAPFLTVETETFDGLTVTTHLLKDEETERTWARIEATAGEDRPTDGAAKEGEAPPDPKADAATIGGTTEGWIYQLPDFKVNAVNKTAEDFVEDAKAGS